MHWFEYVNGPEPVISMVLATLSSAAPVEEAAPWASAFA